VIPFRLLAAALLVFGAASVAVADERPARRVVDLDEPGVLDALRSSHPAHYAKITRLLAGVLHRSDRGAVRWMEATFDARNVRYGPLVLTTHPAKRRLAFSLDGTPYEIVLVLSHLGGDVVPAR
jgi:hypothetical protein